MSALYLNAPEGSLNLFVLHEVISSKLVGCYNSMKQASLAHVNAKVGSTNESVF
jgi:hypothetical protein